MVKESASHAKIVLKGGAVYEFDSLNEFKLNKGAGLLTFTHPGGEFGVVLPHLVYFWADVPPQQGDVAFQHIKVRVAGFKGETETLTIDRVIKETWDVNTGLYMVFGQKMTACFTIDDLISYRARR